MESSDALHGFAFWIRGTSPELFSGARARFCGAQHQKVAAFGAAPLRVEVGPAFEILHMRLVDGQGGREPDGLDMIYQFGDLALAENPLTE